MTLLSISANDVRNVIQVDEEDITDTVVNGFVDDAESWLFSRHGRVIEEYFLIEDTDNVDRQLEYSPVVSVERIFRNEDNSDYLLVEGASDDYEVELTTGVITFDSDSWNSGDVIYVRYYPQLFKKLAKYKAAELTLASGSVMFGSEESALRLEGIREIIKGLESVLKERLHIVGVPTHNETAGIY